MSLPHFSRIQKMIIRWNTRSLGKNVDELILLLGVLVYMGRTNIDKQLYKAKIILQKRLKHMSNVVFDRVILEVSIFIDNENVYIKNRDKAFAKIVQNIQLYAIVLEMFEEEINSSTLQIIRSVIQKAYDEEFLLSKEGKFILESQERNI